MTKKSSFILASDGLPRKIRLSEDIWGIQTRSRAARALPAITEAIKAVQTYQNPDAILEFNLGLVTVRVYKYSNAESVYREWRRAMRNARARARRKLQILRVKTSAKKAF